MMKLMRRIGIIVCCVLLLAGCQSKGDKQMDNNNDLALLEAAEKGDIQLVAELLNKGAAINIVDSRGRTAAMIAVHTNQLELFKLLAEQGADLNIRDQRADNPILYASAEGLLEFVKAAAAAGADMTVTNRFGGTALIPAADRGHVEIVQVLLEDTNVDMDHINNLGWTALLEAIILGDGGKRHQEIVHLLIQHGADVNLADSDGVTPLAHAKRSGYQEIVLALEQAGAH